MRLTDSTVSFVFAGMLSIAIIGCGKSSGGVAVHGHVAYKTEPVANASVMFYPDSGRATAASTNETGDYSASLPTGEYTVAIAVGIKPPAGWKEGDPIPPPKFILPVQFTSRAKSTLKATVREGQDQPIDFDLK